MQHVLRERLAWRRADGGVDAVGAAVMARWGAFLFVGASGLVALALLVHSLRGRAGEDDAIVATLGAVSVIAGALLLIVFDRLPAWSFHAASILGILLLALATVFGGSIGLALTPLYLLPVLFAVNFHPRRWAVLYTLLTIVASGATLFGGSVPPAKPERWVVGMGALIMAALLIARLRARREQLIARLHEAVERVADVSRTDPLTGLINRRTLERTLAGEIARSARTGAAVGLVLGDLDGLRALNARFGDGAGDAALVAVADAMRGARRQFDLVARGGGGEFALLIPEASRHDALLVAERMRARAAEALASMGTPATMSFGVASHPEDGATDADLLAAAGRALVVAKRLGRNRSVVHSARVDDVLEQEPAHGVNAQAHLATVLALAEAIDLRDSGTSAHSRCVGEYAELMARELGLPADRVERVRLAGLLHDVGKIAVPDAILHKPGPLTPEEWEEMRKHPETGARLLGHVHLDDIRAWVLAHHERPDGTGYPQRLAGEAIPLEARILAVADAYEAMTAGRVYRPGVPPETARTELARCAGSQFDEAVVQAFVRALKRGVRPRADATRR